MGRARSTFGGEERYIQGKPKTEGGYLENTGVDGRIILKWIFEK
jgi:hypothetical protein